jgi:DNA-binding winged helix-turn-helix (wHTH) protein
MLAPPSRPRIARFGSYEVDLASYQLRKQGIRIKIHDQPFRILELLLREPGALVTREELRHMLWPDNTFVDFDKSLNAAMAKLRHALLDTAENPRFVETVPRQGYRFICPVAFAPQAEGLPAAQAPSGPTAGTPPGWITSLRHFFDHLKRRLL